MDEQTQAHHFNNADDWDEHWEQFVAASEIGPTPRYRRRLIRSLLGFSPPGEGVRFLEIGSGTGEFAEEFCKSYPRASYLGLELSHTGVQISQRRVPMAQFLQRDLLHPAELGQSANYQVTHALCSEVLEHLENPSVLLRNAGEYCGKGCRLIVTVPAGPMNSFYRHIGHRRHYTPAELAALLRSSGFSVESALGAGFPFFNLFRILIALRGQQFVSDVSGPPSLMVKLAGGIFDALFRLNSRRRGWQTIAVAHYLGQ